MMAALRSDTTLGDLIADCDRRFAALSVSGLALDSRSVQPGDVFLAYRGETGDGRDYIERAVAAGAAAVIAEPGVQRPVAVPLVEVARLRTAVGGIAARFYDDPSAAMTVIGVTGTNGKTSCTQLLGQALRLAGQSCGVIGTLGSSLDGSVVGGGLTTPDPIALQRQLAQWRDERVRHVAMEVSSHGLVQGRVAGMHFRGAVFTNLSRDHLDFHGSMEQYGAAKASLFEFPDLEFAVLNGDDAFGAALAEKLRAAGRIENIVTYGLAANASVRVITAHYRADGFEARVETPQGELYLHSHLLGDFNLSNLLAVVATLGALGVDRQVIEAIAPQLQPITGRMQRVPGTGDIEVIVDYAHTPDGLEHALRALRSHCRGRLWCVFGCGGDRDKGKRPLMGAIAERLADRVVLTSDNPRSENPARILAEIAEGLQGAAHIEVDRALAIGYAIANAETGDAILLAGKGHEDYQLIGAEKRAFSDATVAQAAMVARGRA